MSIIQLPQSHDYSKTNIFFSWLTVFLLIYIVRIKFHILSQAVYILIVDYCLIQMKPQFY